MKVSDFILPFQAVLASETCGICRVRAFVGPDGQRVALLTDLGQRNPGPSVTNSVESIKQTLIDRGYVDADVSVIEHYEMGMGYGHTFDRVILSPNNKVSWQRMTAEEVRDVAGCDEFELQDESLKNQRILAEIERLRHAMNPFIDFPAQQTPAYVVRKLEIQSRMVPKAILASLIESGAGELDLQRLLKRDLSLLGEMYGRPHDEYICFSEFPVADGHADFCVLTGRSRMDVVLVEIKGADFSLVNQHTSSSFSHNIHHAADQIRRRLGDVYRGLDEFRRSVHHIRRKVESGKTLYNSLQGPCRGLDVDPNKDIFIWPVVIGGRTRDDLEESRKRHDFEQHSVPPIRVESWDTWMRKLRRR